MPHNAGGFRISMLDIYITEEANLSSQGMPNSCITSRLTNGDLHSYVKGITTFSSEKEFLSNILKIIGQMLLSDSTTQNLLIISAHGLDDTGTNIHIENARDINLRLHSDYFQVLPNHLVIYLSMCKGAYPGPFMAFFQKSITKPIVISPVVSIYPAEANEFQHLLIDTLLQTSDNEGEILNLVKLFNSQIQATYNHQYAIGMFLRSGEWYPAQGIT